VTRVEKIQAMHRKCWGFAPHVWEVLSALGVDDGTALYDEYMTENHQIFGREYSRYRDRIRAYRRLDLRFARRIDAQEAGR
jgi:hypothetical protein